MKKFVLLIVLISLSLVSFSQKEEEKDDEPKKGFNINNMFIGGGLGIGAGNGGFSLGITPEVGYSLTKWIDAGLVFNVNYQTQNYYDPYSGGDYKVKMFNYGGGTFVRLWPVKFLFATIQPEYNWINVSVKDRLSGQRQTGVFKSESILIGLGYGTREVGDSYSNFAIMVDLLKNPNSPYRDQYNEARPLVRATFGWYLNPSKKR
jgi:hypothetical protein